MPLESKSTIREKLIALLRNQKEEERTKKSQAIGQKLFELPEFQRSRTILFYASFDGEVETFPMMKQAIERNKAVALPSINKEERKIVPKLIKDLEQGLTVGHYGIKEPDKKSSRSLSCEELDLIIVPGVAFDKTKNRLGRGGGYYDRFLQSLPSKSKALTVGLAFDFQILPSLPHQKGIDVPVSLVLTN